MINIKGSILIVGGYGAVGKIISTELGNLFPKKIIVAGRNYLKARDLSIELNQNVLPLELDISSISANDKRLNDISLVIMCIDQENLSFVTQCIERGINYIDITANYNFLSKIERLNDLARKHNSTVVLSVGLAPGLTNLLAKRSSENIKNIQFVNIYILLGIGEKCKFRSC